MSEPTQPMAWKAPDQILCPVCCQEVADRVGAQDGFDVYVCPNAHITRLPVGRPIPLTTD